MIEWAVASSVLILVVVILRRCLIGRISLRLQYGLWIVVLLRLLVPVSLGDTAWSVLNLTERMLNGEENVLSYGIGDVDQVTPELSVVGPDDTLDSQMPLLKPDESFSSELPQVESSSAAGPDAGDGITQWREGLTALWAAGAIGLGLWLVWVNLRFGQGLRRSRRPLETERCPLPVYVTGAAQTPCLFGVVRPCIYVTEETVSDETVLRHSLAHELTHYRHGDHIWGLLRGLCLAIHWYNPLVWLAAILSRRDEELCCDEATVRRLGQEERAAYGRTLLAVTCRGRGNPLLTATSMTGSGRGMKERIRLLVKGPKTAAYTLVAVVLIVAAAVGCTFTGAQNAIEKPYIFSQTEEITEIGLEGHQSVMEVGPEQLEEMSAWLRTFTRGDALGEEETMEPGENSFYVNVVYADGSSQRSGIDVTEWEGSLYHVVHDPFPTCWQTIWDGQGSTYLTSADLDRDGEEERIQAVQMNSQIWQLVVTKEDGTELFREDAGTPHLGWNSLYLYRDSQNSDCLLRYNPGISTGFASYDYTLFTLENGGETVLQEGSLDFEIRQVSQRREELMAFADEVNALLRRSALLLSTQDGDVTTGPLGWGERLEHLSGLGDFLTEEELKEYQIAFQPEIMDGEQAVGVNPASAFFTSYYHRPEELNFETFLQYLPGDELVEDDLDNPEFQALREQPLYPYENEVPVPTPIHRYTRQSVDGVLEQYAGITTRDLSGVGMDGVIYLPEYDAWYNFTSDYGPGTFVPVYGLRQDGMVTLWELPNGNGMPGDVLTLEETADGFRILSHLPGKETGSGSNR